MLSWRLKATIAILLFGLVLAAASLYLIVDQASDLREAQQRLRAAERDSRAKAATVIEQQRQIAINRITYDRQAQVAERQAERIASNERSLQNLRTLTVQQGRLLTAARAQNRENVTRIARQEEDIARNARLLGESQMLLGASERRLAATQSAFNYMQAGRYGMVALTSRIRDFCAGQVGQLPDFCGSDSSFIRFLLLLTDALDARVRAASSGQYEDMRAKYQAIMEFAEGQPPAERDEGWEAFAAEGIAYAEMKLGRLAEAQAMIRRAVELGPANSQGIITSLKIMCRQGRPAREVEANYFMAASTLNGIARDHDADTETGRQARLLSQFLSTDTELYLLCDYANLRQ